MAHTKGSIPDLVANGFSSQRCPKTGVLAPNMTRDFEGFHVSYTRESSLYGCDTTALVLQDRVFFVLNGYHADAMVEAGLQNGIQGCINLFAERISQASGLSEHLMAVGITADPFNLHQTTVDAIGPAGVDRIKQATLSVQQ